MKRVANTVMSLFSSKQGSERGSHKLPPGPKKVVAKHAEQEDASGGFSGLFKKSFSSNKGNSMRSGGTAVTTLSDLEKIEKIMNEAVHASKSIVKYFGKHFEEFRRDMHGNKELVFADMLLVDNIEDI